MLGILFMLIAFNSFLSNPPRVPRKLKVNLIRKTVLFWVQGKLSPSFGSGTLNTIESWIIILSKLQIE